MISHLPNRQVILLDFNHVLIYLEFLMSLIFMMKIDMEQFIKTRYGLNSIRITVFDMYFVLF
jgi:hypothetical protein